MLGSFGWRLPLGAVNRTHLQWAKRSLLADYDAVLVLEEPALQRWSLGSLLGWNVSDCGGDRRSHWWTKPLLARARQQSVMLGQRLGADLPPDAYCRSAATVGCLPGELY